MFNPAETTETWRQHAARTYPVASLFAELEFELEGIGSDYKVTGVRFDGDRLKLSDGALRALSDALHMHAALDGQATYEMGGAA